MPLGRWRSTSHSLFTGGSQVPRRSPERCDRASVFRRLDALHFTGTLVWVSNTTYSLVAHDLFLIQPNFFQDRITQTRANTAEIIWALIMRVSRILSFHSLIQDQTTAELFYPCCVLLFRWCVYLGSSLSPPIDVDVFTHFLGFSDRVGSLLRFCVLFLLFLLNSLTAVASHPPMILRNDGR